MENSVVLVRPEVDGRLEALVRKVEESEEATREARGKSERDRDYLDGKQLTDEEHRTLVARGQPPIAFNVIRSRVDFHQGLEKKQRRDPKAWPRNNPQDAQAADAFTDGMRYCIEEADYSSYRSAAWRNVTVEGYGGVEMWVEEGRDGYDIRLGHIPWDRIIYDPHSTKPDFSDASYIGQVLWMDEPEALARYTAMGVPEEEILAKLETTYDRLNSSETYDDKPRTFLWSDKARKRVRVVCLWCKYPNGWYLHEFTRGGVLWEGEGPYVNEDGETWCPLILESCFVDRENNRYGVVRDLIDPQDEINKRRSKALHLLTVRGVVADEDAVENVTTAKRELAKPDFWISKRPGSDLTINSSVDLAMGQTNLLQSALGYVMQAGPNAALLGKGVEDQSGRAIEAQQAGGMIEHGDLMDTLRRMDRRVFRAVALMIKQFWTAEKWIRVTDDENAPKWVGLNVPQPAIDPMTGQPAVDPYTGQPIIEAIENNVAELDLDISILDAPDVVTLDSENYASVLQLLQAAPNTPPPILKLIVEMHPGLTSKRKKQLLEIVEQAMQPQQESPEQQAMKQLAMAQGQADVEKTQADAWKSAAQAGEAIARSHREPQQAPAGQF